MKEVKELFEKFEILNEKSEGLFDKIRDYVKLSSAYAKYVQDNYPDIHDEIIKEIENGSN